jgi:hypothetical protein
MSKKSLTISGDTTGPFKCVGWKSDRTGIFVLDKEGERRFVELIRPTIQRFDCYKQPFDLSHPTNIEEIRLIPPPCRSSKKEADALANWAKNIGWGKIKTFGDAQADYSKYAINMGCKTVQFAELWEMIYGDCLYPDKNAVEALKPIVSDHYKKQGAEYRHRLLQLKETTKKEIQTLGKDKAHDYNWSERKTKRKNISDSYATFFDDPNKKSKKEWKIPVETYINNNFSDLAERHLNDSWASANGWSLEEIADHRQRYRNSLQTTAIPRLYRPVILKIFEASVRYIIKFQSGATYYLETVFIRDLADKGEIDGFNLFTAKTKDSACYIKIEEKLEILVGKVNRLDHIWEQHIQPNLKDPVVAEEKLILYNKVIPKQVIDYVFELAYLNKPPSITKLQEYVESIKHKAKPEIIHRSRSTISRWLKVIKKSLVKLGYISAEVGDALQHKIREPYNDEIKQKSQKGYGSSGKDYDQ